MVGRPRDRHRTGYLGLHQVLPVRQRGQTDIEALRLAHHAGYPQQLGQMLAGHLAHRPVGDGRLLRRLAVRPDDPAYRELAGVVGVIGHPPVAELVVVLLEQFHHGIGSGRNVEAAVVVAVDTQTHRASRHRHDLPHACRSTLAGRHRLEVAFHPGQQHEFTRDVVALCHLLHIDQTR